MTNKEIQKQIFTAIGVCAERINGSPEDDLSGGEIKDYAHAILMLSQAAQALGEVKSP